MLEYSTPEDGQEVKLPFYARLALTLLCILLIIFLMQAGSTLFIPLFFSVLIAFMLLPVVKWLERRKLPHSLAALLGILLFVGVVGTLFFLLGKQVTEFSKDMPTLKTHAQGWSASLQRWISAKFHINTAKQADYIDQSSEKLVSSVTLVAQTILTSSLGFVIWTIFVFVFTFFILTHRGLIKKFFTCVFQKKYQTRVGEVMDETRLLANSYITGLLLEMLIVAAINCLAFWIFGIKYALLLGVLAAVLNIIPYLGIYTAAALTGLVTLTNSTPGHALTGIIILLSVHFIDANILMPRIVGRRVKMNPLITIVAVICGEMIWGIPGMFLFIPLAAILKIVFERVDSLKPWAVLMGTEE